MGPILRIWLFLIPFLTHASVYGVTCGGLFGKSYFLAQPKSQQLVVGLLVELKDGRKALSVMDYYWGSHEEMFSNLLAKYPLKRILWAGEMLLENPQDSVATASVVLTVNTSGFVTKTLQNKEDFFNLNSPQELKLALETSKPDLRTEFTQYDEYSSEHAHLDPLFQRLQSRIQYNPNDTVRHRFRNILSVVLTLSNYFTHPLVSQSQELERISKVSASTLSDIVMFFESQMRFSNEAPELDMQTEEQFERLKRIRDEEQEMRVADFQLLIDLIKNVSDQGHFEDREPEVIILSASGE